MRESSFISNSKIKTPTTGLIPYLSFVAAFLILAGLIGRWYADAASKNLINAWNQQRFEDFYATEKNTIDIVFIGSSHSYCTFDPELIDQKLGTNSFQMGMPLQHPDGSYYTLLEIFRYQSPSTVVLELYWDMLDDPFEPKQADTLFQVLNNKELEEDFFRNVYPPGDKVKRSINAIRYQPDFLAYQSKNLSIYMEETHQLKKLEDKPDGQEYYKGRGFMYCDTVISPDKIGKANQFHQFDGSRWALDPAQAKYIQKIISLCKEKGATLVFATAPVANASMEFIVNYDAVHHQVNALAQQNGISYLDLNIVNQKEDLLRNENFRDDAHLNYSGVLIVNEYFTDWLLEQPTSTLE